jgi:hypothetical protein
VDLPPVGVGSWARVSSVVPSGRPENHLAWLASACLPPVACPPGGLERVGPLLPSLASSEVQPVQLPLQWPVPLLSWCGVPVHVGSDWAVAGRLPWTLSLHHLPLMSLLPQLPITALQLLAPCLATAGS